MIIEFSGGDGSGKTTAMEVFCERLQQGGARVLQTREVGCPHVPICADLRRLILNPEHNLDGRMMEFVFAAMRIENQKFYAQAGKEYDFIVSDRGWLCHLAYTDHNVSPEFTKLFYLDVVQHQTILPDVIYLFDVDPDKARERRGLRGEPEDAIEAKGHEFQKAVVASYLKYADQFSDLIEIVTVDANQGLDDVRLHMLAEAEDWLNP